MKQDSDRPRLTRAQIEQQLKASVETLTPNVLDRIDLSTPQDEALRPAKPQSQVIRLQRRMRTAVAAAAACLCLLAMGGGAYGYHYQNQRVESVIGIDVNPSVELSVNRNDKVLSVKALNADAEAILNGMDLEGVDLNVAVNAVIGSMVTQGYLDDLDNAILVTVTNDSIRKATALRTNVVKDIELALEENQVQAVVYDQQAVELDEMKSLAEEYGISYGKAYFLKELIEQNKELSMDDMEELSSMTMEEIAGRISDQSYALGQFADKVHESSSPATQPPSEVPPETTVPASSEEETPPQTSVTDTTQASSTPPATTAPPTTEEETEPVKADRVEIDYADYEDGKVYVYFVTKVNWKKPTVSVFDEEGNSYAAKVEEARRGDCVIEVSGLEGGKSYSFVLGGLTPIEGGGATTVTGYFDKPEIAGEEDESEDETESTKQESEEETKETKETTAAPATEAPTEPVTEPVTESKANIIK